MNLPEVLTALGVEVESERGNEIGALCPSTDHSDTNPSWYINTETGAHICFACGFKGGLTVLVAERLGFYKDVIIKKGQDKGEAKRVYNYDQAKEWLSGKITIDPAIVQEKLKRLTKEPEAAYVAPMTEARLGMFDFPPDWALSERRIDRAAAEAYGILWQDEGDLWICPVRDLEGKLLGWQEKSQTSRYFRNKPFRMVKSHTFFGVDLPASDDEPLVLVEPPLDAARLLSAGYHSWASMGSHISHEQILLLRTVPNLVVALDNPALDKAGREGLKRLLEEARNYQFEFRAFDYSHVPDIKAPGDMSDEQIRVGIENARHCIHGKALLR